MPRVSKVTLEYDERWGKEHQIWYTQKKKFEIRDLPQDLLRLTDLNPSHYESEAELVKDARAACRKYRELKKTESKVILYKFSAGRELTMNKKTESHYHGYRGNLKAVDSMPHGAPKASVGVTFKVCKKIDDGVKPEYFEIDMTDNSVAKFGFTRRDPYKEIPFTEQRHQFFLDIVDAMKDMVDRMAGFFLADPQKAIAHIENNQKLLGGS